MTPVDTSRYAPDFEIKIDGKKLDLFCEGVKLYVLSVSIKETINQADSFEFTVAAHSHHLAAFPTGRELACLDDERFGEGHDVEIRMGYVGNLALRFLGQISANSSNFPVTGIPTLTVRGFSYYRRLAQKYRRRPFDSNTDSGIAKEIADELKLDADVDPTSVKHSLVSTKNKHCAAILQERAARINYEVAVKEKTLIFKKPTYIDTPSPTLPPLTWGQDLLSFQPNLSTYGIPSSVEVLSPQTAWGGDKEAIRSVCNTAELTHKLGAKSGMAQAAKL
ncbi:MAG: phage late control D family protein, partial [Caldilineaceae bacterium]|nr:phage late control D family protein [Caldilineaceae bacterium]